MQLETRDLSSFAVLAEQLHFGRAAARLHVSQPALSKRIKSLEEKIGGPLLVRNRRGVTLTPAGAMFYKECRRVTHDLDLLLKLPAAATSGELGKLRLGVGMSTVLSLVPRALLKFREARPGVEIEVADMSTLRPDRSLDCGPHRCRLRAPAGEPSPTCDPESSDRTPHHRDLGQVHRAGDHEGHSGAGFHSDRPRRLRHLSRSLHQSCAIARDSRPASSTKPTTCSPSSIWSAPGSAFLSFLAPRAPCTSPESNSRLSTTNMPTGT